MPVDSLQERAEEHLRVIRGAMSRATAFTELPGYGGIAMGLSGIVAAAVASGAAEAGWLSVWLTCATFAVPVGALTMLSKARRAGVDLLSGPARLFVFSLAPPLLAGAVLTAGLVWKGMYDVLPGVWLILYGLATVVGGSYSIRLVPVMGACFMVLGSLAMFVALPTGNVLLGVGFGGLHVLFGALIVLRYGG